MKKTTTQNHPKPSGMLAKASTHKTRNNPKNQPKTLSRDKKPSQPKKLG